MLCKEEKAARPAPACGSRQAQAGKLETRFRKNRIFVLRYGMGGKYLASDDMHNSSIGG
jgi:hypothetical protein